MSLFNRMIDALKFTLMAVILSFVVFIAYSLEKKLVSKMRDVKGSQGVSYQEPKLYKSGDTDPWRA